MPLSSRQPAGGRGFFVSDSSQRPLITCHIAGEKPVQSGMPKTPNGYTPQAPESSDVAPVYDPRAWETYSRDAKCGCTAPDPADCKIPHGTGAWLCVCHRLSGPPATNPGKPLALLGGVNG